MSGEPMKRLLDDPSAMPQLRSDLRRVCEQPAVPYDAEQGLQRLRASLQGADASGEASEGVPAPKDALAASAGHGLKWWGLAAVGLAALGAVWGGMTASEPAPPALASRSTAAPAAVLSPLAHPGARFDPPAQGVPPAATGPVQGTKQPVALPEPGMSRDIEGRPGDHASSTTSREAAADSEPGSHAPTATASVRRHATGATAGAGRQGASAPVATSLTSEISRPVEAALSDLDPDARKRREIRQLAQARRALTNSARQTLQLAREGQEQFPDGMFVEERGALIVFALHALGNDGEAVVQGRQFLRTHPSGPFSARVRWIVEGEHPGSAR